MVNVIRHPTPAELPGLAAIELAADAQFARLGIVFPPGTTMIEEVSDPGRVYVTGRPPVGFALVGSVDGHVHLDQLAVHPVHERKGLGTALLEAVCALGHVTLTTFRDVPWNAPWYARRGFHVLDSAEWGPELEALVAHERELGIEVAPRVVMRRLRSVGT
ncbi:GNAT family N-acetyltransferase [Herbidospora galbida]|uniref:GNAT family N-acetyltransferase n=1 Tax=Herbidospora galbida TaxID=2575442 RepID=A0A4U3MDH6_9ACTN|nr:GNAT family N-acetyltransferase [Herbidospora galbida]TKK86780.1 GNAT family N-acetyltransferase [Herbidospora galbida]